MNLFTCKLQNSITLQDFRFGVSGKGFQRSGFYGTRFSRFVICRTGFRSSGFSFRGFEFGIFPVRCFEVRGFAVIGDATILFDSFIHIYLVFCICFVYKMP